MACEGWEIQEQQIEAKGALMASQGIWELRCMKKPKDHDMNGKWCSSGKKKIQSRCILSAKSEE